MRRSIIMMVIAVMLLGIGCDQGQEPAVTESPYEGGSQGLLANFEEFGVEEDGMATIFSDETFPVEITLKNKGEEDIPAGAVEITLKGVSPNDFDGMVFEDTNDDELEKVSEFAPEGGEETVDMGDASYAIELAGSYYDATVFASIAYPYQTHAAVPRVCFNTEPTDTTVCTLEGKKTVYSSGAPVKVTAAREARAGANLIAVEFDVENVGGGDVTKPGEEFDNRYDQILFSLDDTSDPGMWECRLGGEENGGRLVDGKGTIRCKLVNPMEEDTMYTKQLDLTISYDYKFLIEQSIRIKKNV
ncbi:hypothetical protein GF345_03230 [Candidatus Woesearchaeota archaeon]|nr:hypothetical protein [Candidatus Woesearchaeota archaeon]